MFEEYLKITGGFLPKEYNTPEEQAIAIKNDSMIQSYIVGYVKNE